MQVGDTNYVAEATGGVSDAANGIWGGQRPRALSRAPLPLYPFALDPSPSPLLSYRLLSPHRMSFSTRLGEGNILIGSEKKSHQVSTLQKMTSL
ncbi:hypothetical protein TNCV_690921 [Trichonephila clavipes]|nr:hypothetical protein TNCV_690921 [Trichonephila clavipes]